MPGSAKAASTGQPHQWVQYCAVVEEMRWKKGGWKASEDSKALGFGGQPGKAQTSTGRAQDWTSDPNVLCQKG